MKSNFQFFASEGAKLAPIARSSLQCHVKCDLLDITYVHVSVTIDFMSVRLIFDDFSVIMSAQCGLSQMHMEHAQSTQFNAPTKALINKFGLYPVFILRLFVLSKSVGY